MLNVHIIVGARPNLMKAAPIYKAFKSSGKINPEVIDTGQHYDKNMSQVFFEEFGLPKPSHELAVGSGSHATQTAKIMTGYEQICLKKKPDWTIVVGDVNSTLACAITAAKLDIPVAHLEAGLRSRDLSMPEEVNRIVTDSISTLLWTPSEDATENLLLEGHQQSAIDFVGNIMIDTLEAMKERFTNRAFWKQLDLEVGSYSLMTFHRPSNVDRPETVVQIANEILEVSQKIPVVFPIHPRTRESMRNAGVLAKLENAKNVMLLEPLGYIDFMSLLSNATFMVSDSGGIQEETSYLGVPCFTVRTTTERPITLGMGSNSLIGISQISESALVPMPERTAVKVPKFWDGHTAQRVTESLLRES